MGLSAFIREAILAPRLKAAGCLVVYDPEQRYREPCFDLASERIRVVDASESSIESREAALMAVRAMARTQAALEGVLIYVPAPRPQSEEAKQADPFSLYAECGAVFPKDDGDEYLSLCLRAKPDQATAIRQVFASSPGGPAFSVIDAIGAGMGWPQLRATLKAESGREILAALLAPTGTQREALKADEGWAQEVRDFLRVTLGLSLKTRGKTWSVVAEELWRFVLFSEFAYDLPAELPAVLADVPRAPPEARPVVEYVCDQLRDGPRTRPDYMEWAERIERDLGLPAACAGIDDLGQRDTFPFEERSFLRTAVQGLLGNDADTTRQVLARHRHSVWLGNGEIQAQWELVRAGLALAEICEDLERALPAYSRSQNELLDFYLGSLREADRLQREFEQAVGDFLDPQGLMADVIRQARSRYRRLAETVQTLFTRHLETGGWPPAGRMANVDAFDRYVADRLKENGRKLAYLMVDALRYELGVVLEKLLSEDGPVDLQAAAAQLPTITSVGMASLLPGARANLSLALENGTLLPRLGESPVANVNQRMDSLARRFGDRFAEMPLADFVRGKAEIADTVHLLVLRSTEIDSQLESNPETTLGLIPATLKLIRVALHKLRSQGFQEAVIVSDHGFFLNAQAGAGDVCTKPPGNWPVNAHDRMLLGDGSSDSHNLVFGAEKLGIRGDFAQVAVPRTLAPYRAGHLYFHGGISLQEAMVPILVVRFQSTQEPDIAKVRVVLNYKNGAKRITTRVPVIEVSLESEDMFSQDARVEILLEAHDAKGNVVGEPRPGGDVDPATRTISLSPGEKKAIGLRMADEFRGKFTIKALNPATLALASKASALALETDYME